MRPRIKPDATRQLTLDASGSDLRYCRKAIQPWSRRVHFALNYFPVIVCTLFLWFFVLVWLNISSAIPIISSTCALTIVIIECLGRRPVAFRTAARLEIRNLFRTTNIEMASIQEVCLYHLRLGKDTCPGLNTSNCRRPVPLLAYFGSSPHDVEVELDLY